MITASHKKAAERSKKELEKLAAEERKTAFKSKDPKPLQDTISSIRALLNEINEKLTTDAEKKLIQGALAAFNFHSIQYPLQLNVYRDAEPLRMYMNALRRLHIKSKIIDGWMNPGDTHHLMFRFKNFLTSLSGILITSL